MEPGRFVAETRFDGAIVWCLAPRDVVGALIPRGLQLERPGDVPQGRHPLVFLFGEHHASKVFFASLALETGVRFLEFLVAVPFVRHDGRLAMFLPRVFSGEAITTWSGNAHYGYAKRMVPMDWLGNTFVVTDHDRTLLAQASVEELGEWRPADGTRVRGLARVMGLGSLPVLGRLADGSLMVSAFDWGFDDACARPIRATVTIADLPAIERTPQVASGHASRSLAVRGMRWRLTWPERAGS